MATIDSHRVKLWTSLALLPLAISLTTLFLWIHAFNIGTNQQQRVNIYLNYFPFIDVLGITLLDIFCCIVAIVISAVCLKANEIGWRVLNIGIIIASSLRLLLTLWGLL